MEHKRIYMHRFGMYEGDYFIYKEEIGLERMTGNPKKFKIIPDPIESDWELQFKPATWKNS